MCIRDSIRDLKYTIWRMLETNIPTIKPEEIVANKMVDEEEEVAPVLNQIDLNRLKKESKISKEIRFSEGFKEIRKVTNGLRSKALSIGSYFVAQLHLANEKQLRFLKTDDEDFVIFKEA
eukprot:TRINITY_DN4879_c0_g1_i1.p1 TRINITY_DN4879_c0_g1~~TRINITY_DN4879_c0_g1_i1.p1  ORF type:complete len:120 (+),score=32.08 TRINITY_DN4879_c0_g1_i1:67-426(+)